MIAYCENFVKAFKPINTFWLILGLEIFVILFTVSGLVSREAVLFLTAVLAFYVLFAPFREATLFFILSIPLFVALPITENFDTMANWRILLTLLFIRLVAAKALAVIKQNKFFRLRRTPPNGGAISNLQKLVSGEKLYLYVFLFFIVAFLSLINAESVSYGLRKILFLANAMMLFAVIAYQPRDDMRTKYAYAEKIQLYGIYALVISLIIGYIQLLAVFFTPLYGFWQWWADRFIPVFYGQGLANLLSYSNTWFSYYDQALPTLRIFSVFPDSHSLALFSLIGMMPITYFWFRQRSPLIPLIGREGNGGVIIIGLFTLLSIILSGSRGFWVSAALVTILLLMIYAVFRVVPRIAINFSVIKGALLPIISVIIIFFALFPAASIILSGSRMGNTLMREEEYESLAFQRVRSIFNIEETSNKGRLDIWESTFASFKKRPLLGVGIGNFPVVISESLESSRRGASAHNLYFDIAAEMGIAGFAVFLLMLREIFKKAWIFFRDRGHSYGIIFIFYLAWILLYSLFDVVLWNDKVLLLFMTQVAVLYLISDKNAQIFHKSFSL